MEALLLQDGAYVSERYKNLLRQQRQLDQPPLTGLTNKTIGCNYISDRLEEKCQQKEEWRIVKRARALDAERSIPHLEKKLLILQNILETLSAEKKAARYIISSVKKTMKANTPVSLKELPVPTQIVLKMFFRTCQLLRDPAKIVTNSRLSVQIAVKLPTILMAMPSCVLSPGLMNEESAEVENGCNICSVFYQLFQLFEELLMIKTERCTAPENMILSIQDRATVIVAYVALSLKYGRLSFILNGIKLLLENADELTEAQLDLLQPLFDELAAVEIEYSQAAVDTEDRPCGYLMSFGKGDHGKLGHGQCVHVSCPEGNCTENKLVPTIIAETKDILFCQIDSLSTHSIAITAKGEAMAWGNGDKFRLGHGSSTKEYVPRTIETLSQRGRVRDLACGLGHTLALMESGDIYAWGDGSNGRLGLGDTHDRSDPTRVELSFKIQDIDGQTKTSLPVRFRHIFCGASHSLGLSYEGQAYAWGKNNQGQCGHGHTNDQWTIKEIYNFRDTEDGIDNERVTCAAGGWEHSLFRTASGRVYSCGCGYKDSRRACIPPVLGHGDCDRKLIPTLVQPLDDFREEIVKVACGWDHSLAISANGKVYTWGSGANGKLGHGDEENFDTPTLVRSLSGKHVKDAKAGCEHTLFMTNDNELWTCGQGDNGRLGHGDNQTRKLPTKVEAFVQCGLQPIALAVGDKYNLVLVRERDSPLQIVENNESFMYEPSQRNSGENAPKCEVYKFCRGRHRPVQVKNHHACRGIEFGATWVLKAAEEINRNKLSPATSFIDSFSATSAALYITGHIDRLATEACADGSAASAGKRQYLMSMCSGKHESILIPFAADTSYEALGALLRLLQWPFSSVTSKEKEMRSDRCKSNALQATCLNVQERMSFTLSCLRILQLNLKKLLETSPLSAQNNEENCINISGDIFGQIFELLDHLSSLKEEDCVCQFASEICQSSDVENVFATAGAISLEAACALKIGFDIFYPTAAARCRLLWEILDDCKEYTCTPSLRTVILSDQLCQDSVMAEIYRYMLAHGSTSLDNQQFGDVYDEKAKKMDIEAIKTLMSVLLKRCGTKAIDQLDNLATTNSLEEPECLLRLLYVLQTHYFSVAYRSAIEKWQTIEVDTSSDLDELDSNTNTSRQVFISLLEYVEDLMTESLKVLKMLHKKSREHDEIIAWRLNGSFFHALLPSAIESLSVLLSNRKFPQIADNLLLVERILPSICTMVKMLDEVSWKMFSASDGGFQTLDGTALPTQQSEVKVQGRNWFIDLGDTCATLCGKLSCELFYQWRTVDMKSDVKSDVGAQNNNYFSLVLSEGQFLHADQDGTAQFSSSMCNILKWEQLGVFEMEDELVGEEEESNCSSSSLPSAFDSQQFLLQLSEEELSHHSISIWNWIAARLSLVVEITTEAQRLLTLVVIVLVWHLDLGSELRLLYELYDVEARNGSANDVVAPKTGIWNLMSILLHKTEWRSLLYSFSGLEAITNAMKVSRFLLRLRPNPVFVPKIFRCDVIKTADLLWEGSDLSLLDMIKFLTSSCGMSIMQHSLEMKDQNGVLLRTGICIMHDLLRKLTTSSTKSCLLDEFVALLCRTNRRSPGCVIPRLKISLGREKNKDIDKAIENLLLQLARIVSKKDASFELRKKALMIWTVPMSDTKRGNYSFVALIAKSGLMSTLVDLLLGNSNVLESHRELDAIVEYVMNCNDDWNTKSQVESGLTKKLAPINAMLFHHTSAQIITELTWEAFCAIALQLSKSEQFAKHQAKLFLRSANPISDTKEPLTPRSTLMSPRRRLTLPKKMVVSSVDEIIVQMINGLYMMLEATKCHLDKLNLTSLEYEALIRAGKTSSANTVRCAQHQLDRSPFNLLGCPVQISQSNSIDIDRHQLLMGKAPEGTASKSLTLSFWVYVEHTGALVSKGISSATPPSFRLQEISVQLVALTTSETTKVVNDASSGDQDDSLIVFVREAFPDHVSIGLSIKCDGDKSNTWCPVLIDNHLPRRKWCQVVLKFDEESLEKIQVFVGGKRSTLDTKNKKVDCLKVLHKAQSWTRLIAGGTVDASDLTNDVQSTELPRLSALLKRSTHGFTAVLDDISLSYEILTEERILRMQNNGPFLFHLKQQQVAQSHCCTVLRFLCQIAGTSEMSSHETSLAKQPSSLHWVNLLTDMLASTCCNYGLTQLYLCQLLEYILPRTPSHPNLSFQTLSQKLLAPCQLKNWSLDDLFSALIEHNITSLPPTTRKQNEALYRTMRQRGMLNCRNSIMSEHDTESLETDINTLALRPKFSMNYAAAVHLFQKLCYSSLCEKKSIDHFLRYSSTNLQSSDSISEIYDLDKDNTDNLFTMTTLISVCAGYSEEVVNTYRASVESAAILPFAVQAYSSRFDSVLQFERCSCEQIQSTRSLIVNLLSTIAQDGFHLPARKEILTKLHNETAQVSAIDQRIGTGIHQRARGLRILMTSLFREKYATITSPVWHDFILKNALSSDILLRIASSSLKEFIVSILGPDANIALKLRRVRCFLDKVVLKKTHGQTALLTPSLADLENLQWRLWEKFVARDFLDSRLLWWQEYNGNDNRLTFEVVAGQVEICDFKVRAFTHFSTVKLNHCVSRGLWYFEATVLTNGLMKIGYVDGDVPSAHLQDQGVGNLTNSWAYDGFQCKKWNGVSHDYGEHWKVDDVVGVLLDTERKELSYFLNGKFLGIAFFNIPITSTSRMFPAVSLNIDQAVHFNFGTLQAATLDAAETQAVGFSDFKYIPAFDDDDQEHLRPVSAVLRKFRVDGITNIESRDVDEVGSSIGSGNCHSESDTDDDQIALDGLPKSKKEFNDEINGQRHRHLIKVLLGLGFSDEWATRCAVETHESVSENSAVAWILEQMEKEKELSAGSGMITNESVIDANIVDNLTLLEDNFSRPTTLNYDKSVIDFPCHSTDYENTPTKTNHFIEAESIDHQCDDAISDTFQEERYRQQYICGNALRDLGTIRHTNLLKPNCENDDYLPLSIVVDTTLIVAYARQAFTLLLLSALAEKGQEAAYQMIQPLLSRKEPCARLCRFLRIEVGLDTLEAAFASKEDSESIQSKQSLHLQQAVVRLLQHEMWTLLRENNLSKISFEHNHLLHFFCQEMLSQCDRAINLIHSGKSGVGVRTIQADALWFAWVSGVVLRFVEDIESKVALLSEEEKSSQIPDFVLSLLSSRAFVDKLVTIASARLTMLKAWRYVSFRLITRILYLLQKLDPSFVYLSATQWTDLAGLFTMRYRREMYNKVFYSDITSTLFALLVRSSVDSVRRDKHLQSEDHCFDLLVSNYLSTEVTISWDQGFLSTLGPVPDSSSDTRTHGDEAERLIGILRVFRGSECVQAEQSFSVSKATLSTGYLTIRNLLPDMLYRIQMTPAQATTGNGDYHTDKPCADAKALQSSEVVVQTRPEPAFELDQSTSGKNLLVMNRNLTAINTSSKKWHSVRATIGFEDGIHAWQVRLDTCVSKNIFIGVCTPDASMENYVGSDAYGYGYLANKAIWHNKTKVQSYGDILKQGDVIQVTLDCSAKTLAFNRNGRHLGIAASNMCVGATRSSDTDKCMWYPAISMYNKDDKITLIPPPIAPTLESRKGCYLNASTLELIQHMQDVVAYQRLVNSDSTISSTGLFENAFEEFENWRRDKVLYREISLEQVIAIDKSKSATDKYGLASGDTVFISEKQYTVLGEYRHELWYEIDNIADTFCFKKISCPLLASWSLSTCREMLDLPEKYSVYRHCKYKQEPVNDVISNLKQGNVSAVASEQKALSFESFVDAQVRWSENDVVAAKSDTKLLAELEAIASAKALNNAFSLSYKDIVMSLCIDKDKDGNVSGPLFELTIARIGLLLHVNRCLYNNVRLIIPYNTFATSLLASESTKTNSNPPDSNEDSLIGYSTEYQQVSPVAALLNSPHWTFDDPSAFTQISRLAPRLLFSFQKERLINESLRRTKTANERNATEHASVDSNLSVFSIKYPTSEILPFWECTSPSLQKTRPFQLPVSTESSLFVQLTKHLTAQEARHLRRESSQPFGTIPISQAFQVHLNKPPTESVVKYGKNAELDKIVKEEQDEDDSDQLQQFSQQPTKYLNLFESVIREIQSPQFPLFEPLSGSHSLQLHVNHNLLSPSSLALSRVQRSQVLLWYYCFGQILGIAWRSRVLLPLQFLSPNFWQELVSPADVPLSDFKSEPSRLQNLILRAIRDGLLSIIPSQCVALLSGDNPSLKNYLSDLDVNYCIRLERHTTYSVTRQSHHDLFWKVVKAFTSVERRMFQQFVNSNQRIGTKQMNAKSCSDNSSTFVLEIADALADGRDRADSCYPVVVSINQNSSRLHLPAYSSAKLLRHKLLLAMTSK